MARGLRRRSKVGRCTPSQHAKAASHRKAEAKWVKKNLERHRRQAKDYYRKNKAKVKAQRHQANTTQHRALVAARKKNFGGSRRGRPREC